MPQFKTVVDPKTGRMATVEVPEDDPGKLERMHRELRDMLDGNKQFHVDPYAAPVDAGKAPDA